MDTAPEQGSAIDVLRRHWGYDAFRPMQEEIIASVVSGQDTIGLLPTGGGKSITFQVPALMLGGVTVVVTPLISLMKDQVDRLRRMRIPAGCLHSGMKRRESEYVLDQVADGKLRLLYVAPERIGADNFTALMHNWELSLFVVDEAHCISQWGYDFRPSYLQLDTLRETFPEVPILALTASATPEVIADIARRLRMRRPARFSLSFRRDNIAFSVCRTEEKMNALVRLVGRCEGSSIVYVRSRRRTLELATLLRQAGLSAACYHAGLDSDGKSAAQEEWMTGQIRTMVATTAFGMGIDKADVRLVVHYDMPSTMEEYYQEAGRAGRDGLSAMAVVLASDIDRTVFARRLAAEFPPKETIRNIYDELCRYLDVPMGGGFRQLYEFRPETMSMNYRIEPRQLLASLRILSRTGYINYIEETGTPARVKFTMRREELYDLHVDPLSDDIIEYLLRNCPGIFTEYVNISDERVAFGVNSTMAAVYERLIALRRMHVVDYVPRNCTPYVYFPNVRVPGAQLQIGREVYEDRRTVMETHLKAMKNYVFADSGCRSDMMLEYFGERTQAPCGKCDLCRAAATQPVFSADEFLRRIRRIAAESPDGSVLAARLREHYADCLPEAAAELRRLAAAGTIALSGPYILLPPAK